MIKQYIHRGQEYIENSDCYINLEQCPAGPGLICMKHLTYLSALTF